MKIGYIWPALLLLRSSVLATVYTSPNELFNGPVDVEFTLGASLDSQKVLPYPNATAYEWWYFDSVATGGGNESITVVFYISTSTGFAGADEKVPLSVFLTGSFRNGSTFEYLITADPAGHSIVTTDGNGASGVWEGTGISFEGTSDLSHYVVTFDNHELGLYGTFTLDSTIPPHLPCGPNRQDATELLMPHVGWANAIADSDTVVDLVIDGTRHAFTGIGYHDQNWGDAPFAEAVNSWYWGHGRVGPYSIVWFDAIDSNNIEHTMAYVVKNGCTLASSCLTGDVKVRPWGGNDEYPPRQSTVVPDGFLLTYTLPSSEVLQFNFTHGAIMSGQLTYHEFAGSLTGGLVGGEQFEGGSASCETFQLVP